MLMDLCTSQWRSESMTWTCDIYMRRWRYAQDLSELTAVYQSLQMSCPSRPNPDNQWGQWSRSARFFGLILLCVMQRCRSIGKEAFLTFCKIAIQPKFSHVTSSLHTLKSNARSKLESLSCFLHEVYRSTFRSVSLDPLCLWIVGSSLSLT